MQEMTVILSLTVSHEKKVNTIFEIKFNLQFQGIFCNETSHRNQHCIKIVSLSLAKYSSFNIELHKLYTLHYSFHQPVSSTISAKAFFDTDCHLEVGKLHSDLGQDGVHQRQILQPKFHWLTGQRIGSAFPRVFQQFVPSHELSQQFHDQH